LRDGFGLGIGEIGGSGGEKKDGRHDKDWYKNSPMCFKKVHGFILARVLCERGVYR
jgi:hypothetical protein